MTVRKVEITPFKVSQGPSTEHDKKPERVKVVSRVAGMHNSGIEPDSLHSALGVKSLAPVAPRDQTLFKHSKTPKAVGAHYNPTESYRKVTPRREPRSTYTYGPGSNRKGDNALGRAMNKVGQKSGYPNFRARGGGKNV